MPENELEWKLTIKYCVTKLSPVVNTKKGKEVQKSTLLKFPRGGIKRNVTN
jgi:hypothetical protein